MTACSKRNSRSTRTHVLCPIYFIIKIHDCLVLFGTPVALKKPA